MAKVFTPNAKYTGVSAGVNFIDGVGECVNPYLLRWFKQRGYRVEEEKKSRDKPKDKPTGAEGGDGLDSSGNSQEKAGVEAGNGGT